MPDGLTKLPIQSADRYAMIQSILSDIVHDNEEKDLLLSELRHRMKNNMQAIQSLLRLKISQSQNAETKRELGDIELHIAALSGVDGELLVREGCRPILLNRYLRLLTDKLRSLFSNSVQEAAFQLDLKDIQVSARTAINVGLFINEAITNSFKHAVPLGASEIGLRLTENEDGLTLEIYDNGPGYNEAAVEHHGGTRLMKRLADKLNATMMLDPSWSGVRYILIIPQDP